MTRPFASLTLVAVVDDELAETVQLERFAAVLEREAVDVDVVLVANAVVAGIALRLKTLIADLPDVTVVFLGERVHDDVARLVGIEHAVGDYVLFCDPARDDPRAVPGLLARLRDGYDLVVAEPPALPASAPPLAKRLLFRAYARLYAIMTDVELEGRPTGLRVLSRAAALFLAGRPSAELLVRARSLGHGFPATAIALPGAAAHRRARRGHSWWGSIGLLLSVSTVPLRIASYAALLGGALSILYSGYVLAIYLLQRDVAAGWTTLSFQLSGMMFIFSVVLLFISEYVIQIHSANPPRNRRYLVLRELRSPYSRRAARLNVVDADGAFQLGKPDWLATRSEAPNPTDLAA